MPSKDQHLAQAKHNADLYAAIDRNRFSDWAATLLFYECLQYVDAYLALQPPSATGIHPGQHKERDNCVSKLADLKRVWHEYRFLKDSSRNARYNPPTRFTSRQLGELETDRNRIKIELARHVPGVLPVPPISGASGGNTSAP